MPADDKDYVKALYYAFGHNAAAKKAPDVLTHVDATLFAATWQNYCSNNESRVNLATALESFIKGMEFLNS